MEDRFKNTEKEKKDKIINAALEEFTANGYEKASTNEIVKNAGISRGLLYHYFKDKKELYDVLVKYAMETLVEKVNSAVDYEETDIFERLKQITFAKIELSKLYPTLFNFVVRVFLKDSKVQTIDEAYDFYEKQGIDIRKMFADIYQKNIDFSKFKEPEKTVVNMNIIRWTLEKWSEEMLQSTDDFSELIDIEKMVPQLDVYINALKKAFY